MSERKQSAVDIAGFTSPRFIEHAPVGANPGRDAGHPERPDRMPAVWQAMAEMNDLARIDVTTPADEEDLMLVHGHGYLERVHDVCAAGGGFLDRGDTYANAQSETVARLGVSACLRAGDAVMAGDARVGFAAIRPPGHHALPDAAMGFCIYANAALLVRHLQRRHGLERIAVLDFDVHHGNGTQACFWRDPNVLAVSLHEDPATQWPHSGYASERGEDAGYGSTLNVPLPAGTGDDAFVDAMQAQVAPAVDAFQPEIIVVCAGFDAAAEDPLGNLAITSNGFARIGHQIRHLCERYGEGKALVTLEGGYDLAALRNGTRRFLLALTGRDPQE
jgi:acetoin utilization deacetylase AcuC-like enzyme